MQNVYTQHATYVVCGMSVEMPAKRSVIRLPISETVPVLQYDRLETATMNSGVRQR